MPKFSNLEAEKQMRRARSHLILGQPFYGALSMYLELKEDPSCPTAWTDGVHIGYNPDFVLSLTHEERVFLFAHEAMHCAWQHHLRRDHRDPKIWNEVCDDIINPHLRAQKMTMPAMGRPGVDEDISAESLYARRARDGKGGGKGSQGQQGGQQGGQPQPGQGDGQGDQPGDHPGGLGEVRDCPADQRQENATSWSTNLQNVARICKQQGTLPAGMEDLIADILSPKVDWKTRLRSFVEQHAKNDYRWNPVNRRHLHRGIYLPTMRGESLPEFVVAIDTSASVSDRELAQFAGELNAMLEGYDTKVHVLYCDTQVAHVDEYASEDLPLYLTRHGGGGTRFAPVWDKVEELGIQPCCTIYMSDMECSDYGDAPPYPVLWMSTATNPSPPPFGEIVCCEVFE